VSMPRHLMKTMTFCAKCAWGIFCMAAGGLTRRFRERLGFSRSWRTGELPMA